MEIHKEVDNTALQVILDLVDDDLMSDVDQLDVGQVSFVFVNGFVHLFVVSDSVSEVLCSGFWVLPSVVRGCGLNFENIAHDDVFIIAF
jgi:hypothetical protein